MGRSDKADLSRRLCGVLDIAVQVIRHLAGQGYTDKIDPALNLRPEKVISETAVLVLAAGACSCPDIARRVNNVAQTLLPYAQSSRISLGICLEPALALDYAEAYACLSRLGYHDPGFEALIEQALASQAIHGHERPPHRQLQQFWIAELLGSPQFVSAAERSSVLHQSVLGQRMDLLGSTRQDIYALTHALLYALDRNVTPYPLPRSNEEILTEVDVLLGRCLDEEDYDLAAELLLAWPLTKEPWTPTALFAFDVLAVVEDKAGFLPSAAMQLNRLTGLNGDERTNYLLATTYHTAYVMGLLCAACLHSNHLPQADPSNRDTKSCSASHLLSIVDRGERQPHWREEFGKCFEAERDALTGFLLNVALRRRMVARDFQGLHELLAHSMENGLANNPAASQAAEILQRLNTASSIFQPHRN